MDSNTITLKEIKEKIIPILDDFPINKAIIFGELTKGEATLESEIGIYIDTNGILRGFGLVELLEDIYDALEIDVNIDLVEKSYTNLPSSKIQEIEDEGIVIYERPE